jgi:membrane-associated phospholipid phosphatase
MSPSTRAKWLVVGAIITADALGLSSLGIRLNEAGLARVAGAVIFVGALAGFYTYLRPNPGIVDVASTMAVLLGFFAASAVLSYLLAATAFPLVDHQLAEADRSLGFDWLTWFHWVRARPILSVVFEVIYLSAIPQLLAIALMHGFTGRFERNSELLWCLMISIAIIVPISALVPAAGAWVEFDAVRFGNEAQVHDFLAMRAGTMHELDLTRLEGLVNLPSFHTTLGVLYAYLLRGRRVLFPGATLLNAVMIVSVLSEGGHYLVDVIAGAAVAVLAIWAARRIEIALGRPATSTTEAGLVSARPGTDRGVNALGN